MLILVDILYRRKRESRTLVVLAVVLDQTSYAPVGVLSKLRSITHSVQDLIATPLVKLALAELTRHTSALILRKLDILCTSSQGNSMMIVSLSLQQKAEKHARSGPGSRCMKMKLFGFGFSKTRTRKTEQHDIVRLLFIIRAA
jgi:hypothetical protein